jgi:cobalt-zinc-cadmium efflux system outer membrane protein
MSLPLPLFQQNEGGIAEAEAGIAKSEALVAEARMTIEMQIAEAHTRLLMARSQYELVAGEMLSAAAENYEAVSEGFKLGRISYLELLEARRTLNTVRRQRIETLSQYHSARIDLEAITGASL